LGKKKEDEREEENFGWRALDTDIPPLAAPGREGLEFAALRSSPRVCLLSDASKAARARVDLDSGRFINAKRAHIAVVLCIIILQRCALSAST
jgi:hypothetical protein